jgi:hypothetical protein
LTKTKRFGVASLLVVLLMFALVSSRIPSISAQEGGSGLQISPTRTELSVLPGEKKSFKITIKNITPGVITAKASINDFESDNNTGTPQIIVDPKIKSDRSIRPFLNNIQDIELKPDETREVTLNIDVASDTAPGAYYGAVRFAAVPKGRELGKSPREIALTASVASLVLLQVPGDVVEGMTYDKLEVLRDGKASTFFLKPPTETISKLTNTGNSFVQPIGRVVVNKGSKEVYSFEFNYNNRTRGTILPKSSRNFKDSLKNVGNFGKFEIVSSLAFRQGGEVISQKKSFWVIPLWMVIVLGVLILVLIIGIFYLKRKYLRHH